MKIVAVLLFAIIANSLAAESDVLNLGDSDFSTRVAETETTLVMFYGKLKLLSTLLSVRSLMEK